MKLIDVINGAWAVMPAMLDEICNIYAAHVRGDKIDIRAVEARLGRQLANEPQGYEIVDGVAIIPIQGVMAKRANLFMEISGGASMQLVARDILDAVGNNDVRSIILNIDSPGGTVDGTMELADIVREAATRKPVASFADGLMASAAYWVGSGADRIVISSGTATIGSIGVVATHVDYSKQDKMNGITRTEIVAGKYKRIASNNAPLSKEGRATIQAEVDYLYSLFVDAVAVNRDTTVESVLDNMADGRIFIGQQAIDAGLVDGVSTLDTLIADMSSGEDILAALDGRLQAQAGVSETVTAESDQPTEETHDMTEKTVKVEEITLGYLKANHADLVEQIETAAFDNGKESGRIAAAEAERERIRGVHSMMTPGHEDLVTAAMFDGKSTRETVAVDILNAERETRSRISGQRAEEAPAAIPPDAGGDAAAEAAERAAAVAEDASLPIEERAKAAWDKDSNIRAEFDGQFESYLAFRKAEERGQVRILRGKASA